MARARLEGLGRALRAVERVPEAMREARAETLHEWAEDTRTTAEDLVPERTGALNNALDHEVDEEYGRAEVGVWRQEQLEYALYVEKGTSSMRDQPYLVPAFEANRRQVPRTYRAAFWRHVRTE
ncbi:HK97-gp10 family putative phage morphogenesis protein [Streptomyces sp. NPDC018031]|uniref:HK97-gp10 family putative phage morphogenesis protein n=1 Tax=Streptomyces sp. NPDC018031 TaxID=3365033 RepID=UPI0037A3F914